MLPTSVPVPLTRGSLATSSVVAWTPRICKTPSSTSPGGTVMSGVERLGPGDVDRAGRFGLLRQRRQPAERQTQQTPHQRPTSCAWSPPFAHAGRVRQWARRGPGGQDLGRASSPPAHPYDATGVADGSRGGGRERQLTVGDSFCFARWTCEAEARVAPCVHLRCQPRLRTASQPPARIGTDSSAPARRRASPTHGDCRQRATPRPP